MMTTTRTALLLLSAALLLPATSSAKPRQRPVQADVVVEELSPLLAVVAPSGAQCRVNPRGARNVEARVPFELAVPPGKVKLDCVLPGGQVYRTQLDVRSMQRVSVRLIDRNPSRPGCPSGGCYGPAMSAPAFSRLHNAMARERSSDRRLEILERTSANASFTVRQAGELVDLFRSSDDRLEVVELVAPRLVDRQNSARLLEKFRNHDDREEARWLLGLWEPGGRFAGRR